jgi:hypothetical protein
LLPYDGNEANYGQRARSGEFERASLDGRRLLKREDLLLDAGDGKFQIVDMEEKVDALLGVAGNLQQVPNLRRPLTNLVLLVAEFGDGIAIEGERSFPGNGAAECFHGGIPSLAHAVSPRKVEQSFIFDSVESKAVRPLFAFYSRLFRFFFALPN